MENELRSSRLAIRRFDVLIVAIEFSSPRYGVPNSQKDGRIFEGGLYFSALWSPPTPSKIDVFATASRISSSIRSMAAVGIVCGLLSKYWSSDKDGTNKQNQNAYTTACEEDPKLKSYGSLFEQRFNKLKSELAAGGKTENYSLNSVKSLCGFLVEMNEDMAEEITASKDVLENEELRSLVDLYYESSTKTLDLFNTVEKCTKKAKLSFLIVKVAIKKFEKESMDDTDFEGNLKKKKKKYAETLVELNKVKAMGDPFGDEYKNQLESVRSEHLVLLKKIHELLVKIDKKRRN
ncbi:UPF0496 protein [Raphanus sativus]|nr:UPF0496 protein [Raphanus sativus]